MKPGRFVVERLVSGLLEPDECLRRRSNETEWPAYSNVAPVSWLIQHDVSEGRAVLDFSEWQRPQEEAKEAAEEVLEGEMPLRMYPLWTHLAYPFSLTDLSVPDSVALAFSGNEPSIHRALTRFVRISTARGSGCCT